MRPLVLPAPWRTPVVAGVLTTLAHVLTAKTEGFGLFRDELYFLACGEHLDFGYVDQPPLVALMAWLARALFGTSQVGLRIFPAVAAGATVAIAVLLARTLGGGRRAEILAAVTVALAPVHLANFGLLTMNSFDVLLWAAVLLATARLLQGGASPRVWLLVGALAGIGVENKLSMAFLMAGLGVGLLLTRAGRAQLRGPWVWLGVGLALALALPYALWQHAHGWPVRDLIAATAMKNVRTTPVSFLAEQIAHVGPLAVPVWLAGWAWLLGARAARPFRPLGWAAVTVLAILLSNPYSKAYFLAPLHVLLLAGGAVAVERWTEATASRRRWASRALVGAVLVADLALLPMVKPVLPVERFVRYQSALGQAPGVGERLALGRLPQLFADRVGWPEIVAHVAQVYDALPESDKAKACILAGNYGEAGAIDLFGPERGLPKAISAHNNYWVWGPRSCTGEVVIVLARDGARLEALFEEVSPGAALQCGDCMPYEAETKIFVGRRIRRPVAEVWPELRRII